MSFPSDSFFDVYVTLTFVVVFIGTLLATYIAPINVWPGGFLFPKYDLECVLTCEMIEIPINTLYGGLINGATYGVLVTIGYIIVRLIKRKKKK